ncbi:MAG: thiamine pyrophosphate-dependent enzyme [Hyphomonadaceae bacterium]|jgi:thiamine pyrophosphate-dependent acetolactate synthase large subunit-like protein
MSELSNLPSQQDAIAAALALYPARPFAVSDIGSQSGWLKGAGHDPRNLYVSGPMGLATSVALGLAAVRPSEQVLAIAGDGALAMNLTSLATIAGSKPSNLSILLVDNRVYEFTASVPTPTRELDWLAVGRAFFGEAQCLRLSELTAERWAGVARPAMIVADVAPSPGKPPALGMTPAMIRAEFLGAARR